MGSSTYAPWGIDSPKRAAGGLSRSRGVVASALTSSVSLGVCRATVLISGTGYGEWVSRTASWLPLIVGEELVQQLNRDGTFSDG
jgi:hypothetical protein